MTRTVPTAALVLPIHVLQTLRIQYIADHARSILTLRIRNYTRNDARLASLPCGLQDAYSDTTESMERAADDLFALIITFTDAIRAAGYVPISGDESSTAGTIVNLSRAVNEVLTADCSVEIGLPFSRYTLRELETAREAFARA